MMLLLLALSALAFALVFFQVIPAGVLIIFISVSLAFLGAVYMRINDKAASPQLFRDRALAVAFHLTSLIAMGYGLGVMGEVSADGKLQPQVYHIFVVPLLLGAFFTGRFLKRQKQVLTNFMQHAAATAFCLYLALKNAPMGPQDIFLVIAVFVWLSTQLIWSQRRQI